MHKVEKTVFISYRRTNQFTALAIFKDLAARGYDVFFDYNSINAGDFTRIILAEIEARAHFIILLTPSTLERCQEAGDWVRREIEHAIDHKRNIIPLMFEGFDFGDMDKYLTGNLKLLKNYNALRIPIDYFDAAMDRLDSKFLNMPLQMVLHPTPQENKAKVKAAIFKAEAEPPPTQAEMTAEEYFERAFKRDEKDFEGKIRDNSEAIRLKPDYADAYFNLGVIYNNTNDYTLAIINFNKAIQLNPKDVEAYINRGFAYAGKSEYALTVADCSEAIRLKPYYMDAYLNRGVAYEKLGKFEDANEDYQRYVDLGGSDVKEVNTRIKANKHKLASAQGK